MKDCCKYFFKANDLQNILNQPLEYCGYCGRKLTKKEFARILKNGVDPKYQQVAIERADARNKLRNLGKEIK